MTSIADIASRGGWRGAFAGFALLAPLAACNQAPSSPTDEAVARAEAAAQRAEKAQHAAERAAALAGARAPAAEPIQDEPVEPDDSPADGAPDSQ